MTQASFYDGLVISIYIIFIMNENYFDKAITYNELYKALKQSCKNVRWKDSVVRYEANALLNTCKLQQSIKENKYNISPYQIFTIYEPKKREIAATRIKDRQLQKSLCNNGLYKDITEHFIYDNCACQFNKGTHFTLNRMTAHLRKYYVKHGCNGWVLKCDIKHFFPSTKHSVAKQAIQKRVSDLQARQIVFKIIDSFGSEKGIGLGSQVSQLIELAVLDDLDHYIKEKLHVKHYIRYMDDFVLIHEDKEYLKKCKKEIEAILNNLGFELNSKTSLYPLKNGIKFIQWHFYLTNTGKIVKKINKKKIGKEQRKLKKILIKEANGLINPYTSETSLSSWIANANKGKSYFQIQHIVKYYNETRRYVYDKCSQNSQNGKCMPTNTK